MTRTNLLIGILFLTAIVNTITVFTQYNNLVSYTDKQIALSQQDNSVYVDIDGDDVTSRYVIIDMVASEVNSPITTYFPVYARPEEIASSLQTRAIESFGRSSQEKKTIGGVVKEVGVGYVIITDTNGDDWQLTDDGSVTPVIYPAQDQSPPKNAKELKVIETGLRRNEK